MNYSKIPLMAILFGIMGALLIVLVHNINKPVIVISEPVLLEKLSLEEINYQRDSLVEEELLVTMIDWYGQDGEVIGVHDNRDYDEDDFLVVKGDSLIAVAWIEVHLDSTSVDIMWEDVDHEFYR